MSETNHCLRVPSQFAGESLRRNYLAGKNLFSPSSGFAAKVIFHVREAD